MPGEGRRPAPDQEQRDRAVVERDRNVLIDAGAGTGKTTILVDRLVRMIAPPDGALGVPIDRLAAITFTRKAAGELRLRIRERLLEELAAANLSADRRERLHAAVGGLDTAYVGTIHSFADRLLRLQPLEARLSPGYEIAEDDSALAHETYETLLHAIQAGTLADELAGAAAAARADEATRAVLFALNAGLRAESYEREWDTLYGLDALVGGFIGLRDVPPEEPPADPPFELDAFRGVASTFCESMRAVAGDSEGARWLKAFAGDLERHGGVTEPFELYRLVRRHVQREPPNKKRDAFDNDGVAWKAWKLYTGGDGTSGSVRDALVAPLNRWLALRLVRLFPVVVALYEKVKARRRALDQLDLLVKLRDLLLENHEVRRRLQGLFDHIFVDEFQDTDPLQAEIVLLLCEREPRARRWSDVELRPGSLTLVGDPKQSIYRFRRADIAMYDQVRQIVGRSPHLAAWLSANFRSVPPLIDWLNDRFHHILGVDPAGRPFDPATGRVFQQGLEAGRGGDPSPPVHILRLELPGGRGKADEYRALEGQALARYLRSLVEVERVEIEDPVDRRPRALRYGDIAVLTVSTFTLGFLFPALDAEGIPYASRGGTLFLNDQLHRQFLLGLRAIADRDDGVAEAALLRPPFFSVDLAEVARDKAGDGADSGDEGIRRIREARALIRELRQRRFDRSPGATARDLLERTAFGRTAALGPNGLQRLARLRELCTILEINAARDGLDYDAVTAEARRWITDPIQLDSPYPVGTEAVQILTVHQAKGLEFPVVVVWDAMCQWNTRVQQSPWRVDRDGHSWILTLDGLKWEEPANRALRQTEQSYLDAERRRVVYVAATRARDRLIVSATGSMKAGSHICADLLAEADATLMRTPETYVEAASPAWATAVPSWSPPAVASDQASEEGVSARWNSAAAATARSRFRPVSVSEMAPREREHQLPDDVEPTMVRSHVGRFGSLFGTTVHQAIGTVLRDPPIAPDVAVRRAAALTGLAEHVDEAVADVERAIAALNQVGVTPGDGVALGLEYPVAGVVRDGEGELASGFVDLIALCGDKVVVLDFKTDLPPPLSDQTTYSRYVRQIAGYAALLRASALIGFYEVRCGLLFTADGRIRWVAEA
jgi:ATP-dependent helicase/nuclease subunit A